MVRKFSLWVPYGVWSPERVCLLRCSVQTGMQHACMHLICIYQGCGPGRLLYAVDTAMSKPCPVGTLILLGNRH